MTALNRLKDGYYNSQVVTVGNPGGLAGGGHVANFPAACVDIGSVALQVGLDAEASATSAAQADARRSLAQTAATAAAASAASVQYEAGVWTPELRGLTTPGVTTYASRAGAYRRIGNIWLLKASLVWTSLTGTGLAEIGGLPVVLAGGSVHRTAIAISFYSGFNLTAGTVPGGFGREELATVRLTKNTHQESASLSMSDLPASGTLRFDMTVFA